MGIIQGLEELHGFAAGVAEAPAKHPDDLRVERVEPWAGLTEPGGAILISIEQLSRGHSVEELIVHEGMHDNLLSTTPFGMLLIALSGFLVPPVAPELDLARGRRLRDLGIRASVTTQEACAVMAASILLGEAAQTAYWERLPPAYRDAADTLRWIESLELTDRQRMGLVEAIGRFALGTPVLDEWTARDLSDLQRWRAYLRDPDRNPDARFRRLCEILAHAPPDVIADQLRDDRPERRFAERWFPDPAGAGTYAELDPQPDWDAWSTALAAGVGASLDSRPGSVDDQTTAVAYRIALPPPSPAFELKYVLTHTVWPIGRFAEAPSAEELLLHRLAKLTVNITGQEVPSFRLGDGSQTTLVPDGMSLEVKSPSGRGIACNLPPARASQYLSRCDDDTTLVIALKCYDLSRGDLLGTGRPVLAGRAHIVNTEHTSPRDVIGHVLSQGLAGSDQILWSEAPSGHPGAAYLLLRPATAPYPIVVCPTPKPTVIAAARALTTSRARGLVRHVPDWMTLPGDGPAGQAHLVRWLNTFDLSPWPPHCWAGGTGDPQPRLPAGMPGQVDVAGAGLELEMQGADAAAARLYRAAIETGIPDLARPATVALGLLHLRLALHDGAMACFLQDRLAGDDFLWSFGRLLAGRAGELVGRYDLARPYYENAIRAPNPDHAIAAELGLADCHAVLGNYREAVELYRRVMGRNHPLHSPLATVQLAKALRDSGRQQEADQLFQEAVRPLAGLPIGQRVAQLLQYSRVVDLWWHDYRQGFPDAAVVDE